MTRFILFFFTLLSSLICVGQSNSNILLVQNFDSNNKKIENISSQGVTIVGEGNNKVAFFDGVDDFMSFQVPHLNGNNDFSISLWVAPLRYKQAASWISKANNGNSKSQFRLGFGWPANKNLNFAFYDNFWQDETLEHDLPLNQWTHLVYTLSPKNKKGQLYINGKIEHEYELKKYMPSKDSVFLGLQWDDYIFYHGYMDEVIFFNEVISETEIKKLFKTFTKTKKVNIKSKVATTKKEYVYTIPKKRNDKIIVGDIRTKICNFDSIFSVVENQLNDNNASLESLLIYKGDQLVLEEYFHGYTLNTLHGLSSVTKSFTSTLLGISIDKGFIKNEDTRLSYHYTYESENTPCLDSITLKHVLNHKSGIFPIDIDEKFRTQKEWIPQIVSSQTECNIGVFNYNELNPEIIIHTVFKNSDIQGLNFVNKYLFEPLDIKNYYWLKDQTGTIDGGTGLVMIPRDMLKFGILYTDTGMFDHKRVLSEEWVKKATDKNITDFKYNYFWWRFNEFIEEKSIYGYSARGFGGQTITIVSELDLIIVTTNSPTGSEIGVNEIVRKFIIPAFVKIEK
jgi:hypothetical protein